MRRGASAPSALRPTRAPSPRAAPLQTCKITETAARASARNSCCSIRHYAHLVPTFRRRDRTHHPSAATSDRRSPTAPSARRTHPGFTRISPRFAAAAAHRLKERTPSRKRRGNEQYLVRLWGRPQPGNAPRRTHSRRSARVAALRGAIAQSHRCRSSDAPSPIACLPLLRRARRPVATRTAVRMRTPRAHARSPPYKANR